MLGAFYRIGNRGESRRERGSAKGKSLTPSDCVNVAHSARLASHQSLQVSAAINFHAAHEIHLVAVGSASSSLLKNPRQNESSLIQFFYHESVEARMRGAFTDQGQLFSYISP